MQLPPAPAPAPWGRQPPPSSGGSVGACLFQLGLLMRSSSGRPGHRLGDFLGSFLARGPWSNGSGSPSRQSWRKVIGGQWEEGQFLWHLGASQVPRSKTVQGTAPNTAIEHIRRVQFEEKTRWCPQGWMNPPRIPSDGPIGGWEPGGLRAAFLSIWVSLTWKREESCEDGAAAWTYPQNLGGDSWAGGRPGATSYSGSEATGTPKGRVQEEKAACEGSASCPWAVPPGLTSLRMVSPGQSQVRQPVRCGSFPAVAATGTHGCHTESGMLHVPTGSGGLAGPHSASAGTPGGRKHLTWISGPRAWCSPKGIRVSSGRGPSALVPGLEAGGGEGCLGSSRSS